MEWIQDNLYWLIPAVLAVIPAKYHGKVKSIWKVIWDIIQEKRNAKGL